MRAAICRRLLSETLDLFDLGGTVAIDASSFERVASSKRYAQRTEYRFPAMKSSVLTDCATGAILDVHCTTSRPYETQNGWQVLTRNLDRMEIVTGDKGYDWSELRTALRDHNIRPVIKHREFDALDKAHNARINDDVYHQRSMAESSFAVLKQRYNDRLSTRIWYQQLMEVILKAVVKNIDRSLGPHTIDFEPFNKP